MSEQPAPELSAANKGRIVVHAVLRTDVGLVRSENQDFGALTTSAEEEGHQPGGRLLIVADGMGGHRGGATASRLAAETIKAQYLGSETHDIAAALKDSLTRANARIYSEAQANPDLRGMGTTTSALVARGNQAWFGHVGDSRIYLVRSGEIRQLTEDHSLVASMVREGLLTPKEAEVHPRRNVLQRSMGVAEDVEIDIRGPFDIRPADVFILCSDGLHGLVREPELLEVAALPIEEAADRFIKLALERGAHDNVTVIVAKASVSDDFGDETLLDSHRLDETQKLSEPGPFDETYRDTAPMTPVREPLAKTTEVAVTPRTSPGLLPTPKTSPGLLPTPVTSPGNLPTPQTAPTLESLSVFDDEPVHPPMPPTLGDETVLDDEEGSVFEAAAPHGSDHPTLELPTELMLPDTDTIPSDEATESSALPATIPDSTPLPADAADEVMGDETRRVTPTPSVAADPVAVAGTGTGAMPAVTDPPVRKGKVVMVMLIVIVLIVSAAGMWFYWDQKHGAAAPKTSTTSIR